MAIRQTVLNEAPFTNYWKPDAAISGATAIASRVIQCDGKNRLYSFQVTVNSACTFQIYFTNDTLADVLAGTATLFPVAAADYNADMYETHMAAPICIVIAVTGGGGNITPIVTGV